jgi:ATP-dependent helicase HrpB
MSLDLPINAIKNDFLTALATHQTLILSAPPGAGKSTCLPLWLLDVAAFKDKKIYLLQPRRIAAKNIACYLAEQLGEPVGQRIGYRLKNDSKVSKNTQLEVITEGILTQIIQHDPELSDCGLIVLDEFHERSLHADLAFALARDVQQGLRDDLSIVLMSATLASEQLLTKLPDAIALSSEGRSYPVEIAYQAPTVLRTQAHGYNQHNAWRVHALNVIKQQAQSHQGSILVFLPGVADIRFLAQGLQGEVPDNMSLNPLYGELSIKEQQQAIAPCKKGHKLVLATNIAETSLTIEGINLVIDCGFEKVAVYDQKTLTNRLNQQNISKASATQRAGRAGRLMAGKCLRLYSQEDFQRRNEHNTTEINQADILPLMIEAARWGVSALNELPFIELPPKIKEQMAWQELQSLSIVDSHNHLTAHGKKVAALTCHPRFAHMIIMAQQIEQTQKVKQLSLLACICGALLESRDVFRPEQARFDCDFRHRVNLLYGNKNSHSTLKNIPSVVQIKQQVTQLAKQIKLNVELNAGFKYQLPLELCGLLLALAYPERVSGFRNKTGEYLAQNGKGLSMNSEDALAAEPYIVAAQISQQRQQGQHNRQNQPLIRLAAPIDIEQLIDWQLVSLSEKVQLGFDNKQDRIVAKQQSKLGAIVIDEQSMTDKISAQQISVMWLDVIKKQGLKFIPWPESSLALLARWRWLNQYQSSLGFPDVSEDSLLLTLEHWLGPFVGNIKTKVQLKKLDLKQMLLSLLDYQQQQRLSAIAPTHFVGPTGRRCPIRYSTERSPIVSLPMQELYGVQKTPVVGELGTKNEIPLILEILSPAKRPIQVTQDLVTFWQGSYKAVQKDMKSQYPRHYWPDDPANAVATNKTKRRMGIK